MIDASNADHEATTGDDLVRMLAALANPHRIRILAALRRERIHVSALAREVGLSRPLVHMHLRRLAEAGLVIGHLELSEEGKAMRYYEVAPFDIPLTPALVAEASRTLSRDDQRQPQERGAGR